MLSAGLPTRRHRTSAKGTFHPLWHEPLEITDRFTRRASLNWSLSYWRENEYVWSCDCDLRCAKTHLWFLRQRNMITDGMETFSYISDINDVLIKLLSLLGLYWCRTCFWVNTHPKQLTWCELNVHWLNIWKDNVSGLTIIQKSSCLGSVAERESL